MQGTKNPNPKLFIGSSEEGREIAEYVQLGLHEQVETTLWSQGAFGLSEGTLEALTQISRKFDFAVLVLTPGDVTGQRAARDRQRNAPRDNVLFELGLFLGTLGKERTFIVHPQDGMLELPTDLAGVTAATYAAGRNGTVMDAVGPICAQLQAAIRKATEASLSSQTSAKAATERSPTARRRRRRSLGTACTNDPRDVYQIANISTSGALLELPREIEARQVGQEFDMNLNLDEETTARVTAKVVRVQRPDWGLVGGVGVVFTEFEEPSRQTIERWVEADPNALD